MADTLFVQLVWEHNEFNEDFDWQTFMYVSHTAYNLADDPNNNISSVAMLQHRSAMYQEMFQPFLSVLPGMEPISIHCFVKEVATIVCQMANKGQDGMTYHTRAKNVERIWCKIVTSRWTSKTHVVCALTSKGKLYQAILLVYVYWNRNLHNNPQAIFDWACWVLRFQ